MAKEYVLKVYPAGMSREVYRTIAVSGNVTLNGLCRVILDAYGFIDEHLYEFCMDNRMFSEYAYQSDPEGDEPSADIRIDRLGLTQGQNFTLHYDFGDDWMFVIHVQKITGTSVLERPVVLKSKGEIEQYPDWDEEEDDE